MWAMKCANVHDKLFVTIHYLDSFIIDYYYITMSTYTFTVGSITWKYQISGSAWLTGSNAMIGDGYDSGATTQGTDISGAIIVPSVVNGYTVTHIAQYAFSNCLKLTSVRLPANTTTIGLSAFKFSNKITSISIPESITSVADDAFGSTSASLTFMMYSKNFGGGISYFSPGSNNVLFGGKYPSNFVLPPPRPTMTITSNIANNGTTNKSIPLTFTASASITNFVVGDISVTNGTLSALTGSGSVYNATFTPAGQGACTIGVAAAAYIDEYGSNNTASTTFNLTFDNVSPSMTITSTTLGVTSGSIANNKFIELTFTSTETTNNFAAEDISVTNGTLSNFTGIGAVYTATFTPVNDGACTINVAAGAYTDTVGNNNTAATFNWTFSTAWNVGTNSNHLIKSYIKDFVDVSGSVVLRQNSNLYISGSAETAGNVSLNRLFVAADASFNRRIFVGGDVSMNGNVAMIGDLSMNGSVTKCNFNSSSIPKSAFASTVPDGADYNTSKIVYDQTFQSNDDVSMNGAAFASNNVKVSGNIVFNDGTVMNTADNNILTTNPTVFKPSTFTALDICGNLVAGSYATSSDYRIKTNVVELDETYTVDKLRPVKYFQTQINREKYGLIAHELQEHYPDLVIGEKDGSELQRVNYTGLIAILINDIKRLKRELTELENEVVVGR